MNRYDAKKMSKDMGAVYLVIEKQTYPYALQVYYNGAYIDGGSWGDISEEINSHMIANSIQAGIYCYVGEGQDLKQCVWKDGFLSY